MQALSKPFVGQKIECRSARQTQRMRTSLLVRASQEQQDVVRFIVHAGAYALQSYCFNFISLRLLDLLKLPLTAFCTSLHRYILRL